MAIDSTQRIPVRHRVTWSGDEEGDGIVMDLSMIGCHIQSFTNVPPGSYLTLQIIMNDGHGRELTLRVGAGVVRWSKDVDFGVEFLLLSEEGNDQLQKHLDSLLGPPQEKAGSATIRQRSSKRSGTKRRLAKRR